MDLFTLFTLAVGLSMDAFAVSICKGLSMEKLRIKNMAAVGLWFGGFQALMPVIGYLLGVQFKDKITAIDHWIAFILLGFIGINMIRESLDKEESCPVAGVDAKTMFPLAVATSIDALAVGITFAFLDVAIVPAAAFICLFRLWGKSRQCLWDEIQSQSGTCRRYYPGASRIENITGTSGHTGINK